MFRKLRDHLRIQESHCVCNSSFQGCFAVGEGSSGCCPRESRYGCALGGLCARSLFFRAGHGAQCGAGSMRGVCSDGQPQGVKAQVVGGPESSEQETPNPWASPLGLPVSGSLLLSYQRHHSLSAPSFFSRRLTPVTGWTDVNSKCTTWNS